MKPETHPINVTWQKCLLLGRKAMTNLDRVLKSRDIILQTKVCIGKAVVFPVVTSWQMCELDHQEGWVLKNWCFQTAVLEKTLESPLVREEIKPVNHKGNQPWIFNGRTDAEAEAPNWFIGKEPDAGKDWGQEEKEAIEDEKMGWCHWLSGHEFEQTPGASEGQGILVCFSAGVAKSRTQRLSPRAKHSSGGDSAERWKVSWLFTSEGISTRGEALCSAELEVRSRLPSTLAPRRAAGRAVTASFSSTGHLGADIKAESSLLRRSCACKIVTAPSPSFPAVQTMILHISLPPSRPSSISIRTAWDEHCPKSSFKSLPHHKRADASHGSFSLLEVRSPHPVCRITASPETTGAVTSAHPAAAPALHETLVPPLSLFRTHLMSLHGCWWPPFIHFSGLLGLLRASAFDLSQSLLSHQMVLVEKSAIDSTHYRMAAGRHRWSWFSNCLSSLWAAKVKLSFSLSTAHPPPLPNVLPLSGRGKMVMVTRDSGHHAQVTASLGSLRLVSYPNPKRTFFWQCLKVL